MGRKGIDVKLDRLQDIRLFRQCARRELRQIGRHVDEVQLADGSVLCEQGRTGRECFVLLDGEAVVTKDGAEIAILGPGEVVGEMALLEQSDRTATVTTRGPVTAYVIHTQGLRALLDDVPSVAVKVMSALSERLRRADDSLAAQVG